MLAKMILSSALAATFSSAFAVDERLPASGDAGYTATGLPHTTSAQAARPSVQRAAPAVRRAWQTPDFGARLSADGSPINADSGELHKHRHAIDQTPSAPAVTRGNVD